MAELIGYIPHGINFVLCSWVLLVAAQNMWLNRSTSSNKLRNSIYLFVVFQVVTMVAYLYNQSVWIINDHEDAVGMTPSLTWLLYDYANSIFHLFAASLVTHYIKGRCTC